MVLVCECGLFGLLEFTEKQTLETKKKLLSQKQKYILVILIYTVFYVIVSYFHEPWFDEAETWLIGRDASLKDLLFLVPHGEGHPPLWSLILAVPAKLGVPYLWGIKSVAFIFSLITVILIEFKSPFPNIVKYLLPFSYFYFYQYGVISRTYCVMMVVFCLIAMTFPKRNEKPLPFLGTLTLLCLTSAYGLILAGGLCVAWCIDILKEHLKAKEYAFLKDKRVLLLFLLLILAILIALQISPYENTRALTRLDADGYVKRLIYTIFSLLGDTYVSSTFPHNWVDAGYIDYISGTIVTLAVYFLMILGIKRDKLKYYFIPVILLSFVYSVYGFKHHSGVYQLFFTSFIWMNYDLDEFKENLKNSTSKWVEPLPGLTSSMAGALPVILLLFGVFYSAFSSIVDINTLYNADGETAEFIKEHNLQTARVMTEWDSIDELSEDGKTTIHIGMDTNHTADAVGVLAYFDENFVFNHNTLNGGICYVNHFVPTEEENQKAYEIWREGGIPEVLIGEPKLEEVYGDECKLGDYVTVYRGVDREIWKGSTGYEAVRIRVRKDLLDKYNVQPLKD